MGGNHPRQRRGHLWPKPEFASAFVLVVVKLADDFAAAFGREQFERFERWTIVFAKSVSAGGSSPALEDELPGVSAPQLWLWDWFGIKVPEAGQTFHLRVGGRLAGRRGDGQFVIRQEQHSGAHLLARFEFNNRAGRNRHIRRRRIGISANTRLSDLHFEDAEI